MTPQSIFERYEEVKPRLPSMTAAVAGASKASEVTFEIGDFSATRSVSSLLEIADSFDAFLFDAFGVLNVGEDPIEGAPECFAALQAQGKQLYILTNSASYVKQALVDKFQRLGYDIDADHIVSSREVLIHQLESYGRFKDPDLNNWGVISICDLSDLPSGNQYHAYDYDNPQRNDDFWQADAYIFLSSAKWQRQDQDRFLSLLKEAPKPVFIGNPDLVAPRGPQNFSLEPGYFAHEILDQTAAPVEFFGKPFGNSYDYALDKILKINPAQSKTRILMLGDTLHTDILGGRSSGIKSALVTDHGTYAGQDVAPYIEKSNIVPDYILPSI